MELAQFCIFHLVVALVRKYFGLMHKRLYDNILMVVENINMYCKDIPIPKIVFKTRTGLH